MQSSSFSNDCAPTSSSSSTQQHIASDPASPERRSCSVDFEGIERGHRSYSSQPSSLEEEAERLSRDGWSSNDHTEIHTPSSRTSIAPTLASPGGSLGKEEMDSQGFESVSLEENVVGLQDTTISQDQATTINLPPPPPPPAVPSPTSKGKQPSSSISPSKSPNTSSNWLSRSASKMSIGSSSNTRNRSSSVGSSNHSPNRSRPHTSAGSSSTSQSTNSNSGNTRQRAGTWRRSPGAISSSLALGVNPSAEDLNALPSSQSHNSIKSNGTATPSAMRTPRSSMYATIASPPPSTLSSSQDQNPEFLVPSSPNTDKRRLFGRTSRESSSGSLKTPNSPSVSNQDEDQQQQATRGGGAKGFVKRMGSRTFFKGGRNNSETQLESGSSKFTQQIGASTDTLSSVTSQSVSSSTTKNGKRLSEEVGIGRASSLTAWAKRRSSKTSIRSNINEPTSPQIRGVEHPKEGSESSGRVSNSSHPRSSTESSQSFAASNAEAGEATGLGLGSAPSDSLSSAPNGEGVPKRLSSWLLNMISTDSSTQAGAAALEELANENNSRSGSQTTGVGSSPLPTGGMPAASRSKTSLLSSISASARARALGYAGAGQQPHNGGNGAGSSVGGGLDRALRYFMDSDSGSSNQADEGIWLLGVWHGASSKAATQSTGTADFPSSPPIRTQGPSIAVHTTSPEIPHSRSRRSNTLPSSPSKTRITGASKAGDLEQVDEVSTSPSKGGSVSPIESPRTPSPLTPTGSDTDIHIVARNPPTPHTSPQPSKISANSFPQGHLPSSAPNAATNIATSGVGWQSTFQPDFSSRIWCTYRNQFPPIARDGTISEQAENAAALESARVAALLETSSSSSSTSSVPLNIPQPPSQLDSIQTSSSPGSRLWLGRKNNDNASSSDLVGAAPSSSPTNRFTSGGLGAALGIGGTGSSSNLNANTTSGPPISSSASLTLGLSDKMGIPGLWGRATAAAQAAGLGGRQGLSTDAGWGCMLRTGQSLLANALLNVHLGRTWSKEDLNSIPSGPVEGEEASLSVSQVRAAKARHANYVKLLTWFLDDPSPACPFSVHRMAREGKRLGKEVGEWFGPSTAAGAIKKLVDDFPQAGIGVSVATDGVVYRSHVRAAAAVGSGRVWERPVLVLIGIRLGLEGVNPMYYESVKVS